MTAQRRVHVVVAEATGLLEDRDHRIGELIETTRSHVGHQDEAVGSLQIDRLDDPSGHLRGRPHERGRTRHLDDQLSNREVLRLRQGAPLDGRLCLVPDGCGTSLRDARRMEVGLHLRQRSVRVVGGQVAVPDLLEEQDGRGTTDLLAPDVLCALDGVPSGLTENKRGGRKDLEVGRCTPVRGKPALDVTVEGPAGLDLSVPGENAVGVCGSEFAARVRIPRLKDDGMALRRPRHVEPSRNVELRSVVFELPLGRVDHEAPGVGIGHDGIVVPAVPELACGQEELSRSVIARCLGQKSAAAEVLTREGIPRRHHVPGRSAPREVVERGQLTRHLEGLVEGRVDGARQTNVLRDRRQRSQNRERIGPTDDVEIVYLTALLAQPQALGEKEEVEFRPFGRLGQLDE